VAVRRGKFTSDLKRFSKVALDSSLLIYHLEGVEPYADLTESIFAAIGEGAPVAVLSTLSVTELLMRPFVEGRSDRGEACERFISSLPNTELIAPSYAAAREAARLRARYKIGTPDALLLATALTDRADGFLTNDGRLLRLKAEGISVMVLDDYT
jgi:predicted nucleic acid-binding protein